MPNKKGEMSDLLKYVLIGIAGLILLTLFIIFARNITESGSALSSTETRETLNDYFTALSTVEFIQAPGDLKIDTTILFNTPTCQQLVVERGEGGSLPSQYNHIIYAPKRMTGKSLNVWSFSWFYPYRVTNFFYLTNNRIKTILVGDQELINELMETIPPNMNVERGTSTNINDYVNIANNFETIKIIVAGQAAPQRKDNIVLISIDQEGDSCLKKTDGSERHTCTGKVRFPEGEETFNGIAMLYGTIFTTTLEDFKCNKQAAGKQLQLVSSIYAQKQNILRQKLNSCTKYVMDFGYSVDGAGWDQKANNLYTQNRQLGGRTCEYVF